MAHDPIINNDQYIDLRNCNNASLDIKLLRRIGFLKNPFDCTSDILWFEETEDFKIMTYESDGIEINREEVVTSLALAQTTAGSGSIAWAKEIGITADFGSRFLQFIIALNANEKLNGKNGDTILAYANGGIWFEEQVIVNGGEASEFKVTTVYPNLKASSWLSPTSGNVSSEAEHTFALMVEDWPATYFGGTAPLGFATPKGATPITISSASVALTDTELTFTSVVLVDANIPPLIDIDILEPIAVGIYDAETGELLAPISFFAANTPSAIIPGDFAGVDSVMVTTSYLLDVDLLIPYRVAEVTKSVTP